MLKLLLDANIAHKQQREKMLLVLTNSLECVKFCGQQGLAFPEHRFGEGINPGNLHALVDFRALSLQTTWSIVLEMPDIFLLEYRMSSFSYVEIPFVNRLSTIV